MIPPSYSKVRLDPLTDDSDCNCELPKKSGSHNILPTLLQSLTILLLLGIIYLLSIRVSTTTTATVTLNRLPSSAKNDDTAGCGTTPQEAIAHGCVFDLLNYAWSPPACYSPSLMNEYLNGTMYKWYLDRNATQELPQDTDVLSHQPRVWTQHGYHLQHCLYAWKVLHHAVAAGSPIIEFVLGEEHTDHCIRVLRDHGGDDKDKVNTVSKMWFNKCVWNV